MGGSCNQNLGGLNQGGNANVHFNGKLIHKADRGISMTVLNPMLQVVSNKSYDTYASTAASTDSGRRYCSGG